MGLVALMSCIHREGRLSSVDNFSVGDTFICQQQLEAGVCMKSTNVYLKALDTYSTHTALIIISNPYARETIPDLASSQVQRG